MRRFPGRGWLVLAVAVALAATAFAAEPVIVALGDSLTAGLGVAPDEAYGPRREDLVLTIPRDRVPPNLDPEVGQYLQMRSEDGNTFEVRVTEVSHEAIRLDANHPLAGKELTFEIELVSVAS